MAHVGLAAYMDEQVVVAAAVVVDTRYVETD